jgi:hypothetical protein
MAVKTGTIKSIEVEDGQLKAFCDTGFGPMFTATIPQMGGDFRPIAGDSVTAIKMGQEWIAFSIVAKDAESGAGEHMFFARNAAGEVVSSVHAKADGSVVITPTTTCSVGNGGDFVALSQKVDILWTTLWTAFNTWAPVAQDGGAALKTAFLAAFPSTPQSTASTNLKAD